MNSNSKFKCREQDITFCETLIQRTAGWCKTGKRMEGSHLGAVGANRVLVVSAGDLTVKRGPIPSFAGDVQVEKRIERSALPTIEVVTRRIWNLRLQRGISKTEVFCDRNRPVLSHTGFAEPISMVSSDMNLKHTHCLEDATFQNDVNMTSKESLT